MNGADALIAALSPQGAAGAGPVMTGRVRAASGSVAYVENLTGDGSAVKCICAAPFKAEIVAGSVVGLRVVVLNLSPPIVLCSY